MTYSTLKPDAGPSPKIDVDQIRTNFQVFENTFTINHTDMNKANSGDHDVVLLKVTTENPSVTENLDVLYSKLAISKVAPAGEPQLFVKIPKFLPTDLDRTPASNKEMQLTYSTVNTAGPQYQSFFPGGYVMYTGSTTNYNVNIVLSPEPTAILCIIATVFNVNTSMVPQKCSARIIDNKTFKIDSSITGLYTIGWTVIAQA